jgi:hypothetical protein
MRAVISNACSVSKYDMYTVLWFDLFLSPFVSLFDMSLYCSMKFCAHKEQKTLFARSLYFSMHSSLVCLMKKECILYNLLTT